MFRISRFLEDGNWHSLEEIAGKLKVEPDELADYCQEASKSAFVDYDAKSGRVRLGHDIMSMILQLKAQREREAEWERKGAGTTILPTGKGFQVQGLWVQNRTESDLKIEFTFNIKPKEIVISKAET
jgi:hypothetical protein